MVNIANMQNYLSQQAYINANNINQINNTRQPLKCMLQNNISQPSVKAINSTKKIGNQGCSQKIFQSLLPNNGNN